jgi:hypothetical protein
MREQIKATEVGTKNAAAWLATALVAEDVL